MQKHAFNVVYTLQSKLANVSNEFRSALETRNEVRHEELCCANKKYIISCLIFKIT